MGERERELDVESALGLRTATKHNTEGTTRRGGRGREKS